MALTPQVAAQGASFDQGSGFEKGDHQLDAV